MSLLRVAAIPQEIEYAIEGSLRFRGNAYLQRTLPTGGSTQKATFSLWVKRTQFSGTQFITCTAASTGNEYGTISFSGDVLSVGDFGGSSLTTTQVLRDPFAWYHIVVAVDTTQATAADRVKLYLNGSQVTSFTTATYPALNATFTLFNTSSASAQLTFGMDRSAGPRLFYDGYLAETYLIDAQQLPATSFGEVDGVTGVWKPKKYTGTYGTTGFYLPFTLDTTPVAVGTTTNFQNGSNTTITVNVPSGTINNDLLVLIITSGSANTWTTPAGWTVWLANTNGRAIFYKIASAEPASYVLTQSGNSTATSHMLNYRNAAIDVMGTLSTSASPSVAPSITTTAANDYVFYFIASPNNGSVTYTTPSGFTPFLSDSDATQPSTGIFIQTKAAAGATGTASSTPTTGLPFSVQFSIKPSGLIRDFGTNGLHFTPTNISSTAGITYDYMKDVPTRTSATTANFPVVNRLVTYRAWPNVTNGNLTLGNGNVNSNQVAVASMAFGTGKYYWESTITALPAGGSVGLMGIENIVGSTTTIDLGTASGTYTYLTSGSKSLNGTSSAYGASFTTGDVIGMTYDGSTGVWAAYKNNVSQGTITTLSTSIQYVAAWATSNTVSTATINVNFGQRPFTYTPPTGFVALNTFTLGTPTISKGNVHMDATLWAGNNASPRSITNAAGFKPDFVWIKNRTTTDWNNLFDSVRGVNSTLYSNTTAGVQTGEPNGYLSAFNSNGFSVVSGGTMNNVNANASNYVGWQWKGSNATAVTNTSGSITSTVSANTTAGFSIVTYTGNGGATASVGHGLGVAPKVIIIKARSTTGNWGFYTTVVDGSYDIFNLNTTDIKADSTAAAPTSSVFNLITTGSWNTNAVTYVAYCWAEIAGFSAFGRYGGNGSTDGTFVYTGFRPKFILTKISSGTVDNWTIMDTSRDTFNASSTARSLEPDVGGAEFNGANTGVDLLCNGFKVRNTWAQQNTSGSTYIYAAFAENPFKYSLAR